MKKNIVIVHYNTPLLTSCLVRSINRFVDDAVIYIFDNSDKYPFTAEFDNVTIIDNTKGQIIDFDKWLEGYPNRFKSKAKINGFASAKHCYSVEKCINLINEPFILLDSDVLLKKDISELYDENSVFVGEIATHSDSIIKRVLPFLCYVNVDFLVKNDRHYFDEKYMHGLYYTKESNRYDTGAGFYVNTLDLPHKEVTIEDYIVHYGHGSWSKEGYTYNCTAEEWLLRNKKYWSNEKNKKVIYTCITGGYDKIIEPKYVNYDFDYICFTDNPKMTSDVWEIRPLPKETDGLSQVKSQRYVKINPHKVLREYDISIWVDGNITILGDMNELLNNTLTDYCSVYTPQHPLRNCIYDEMEACISRGKDTLENMMPQIERYRAEAYPKNNGLTQDNIIVRKHNDDDCIKLMDTWFTEVKNGSHRDQLSFNYASWKNQNVSVIYMDKMIYNSKWFYWNAGHTKYNTNKVKSKTIHNSRKIKMEDIGFF